MSHLKGHGNNWGAQSLMRFTASPDDDYNMDPDPDTTQGSNQPTMLGGLTPETEIPPPLYWRTRPTVDASGEAANQCTLPNLSVSGTNISPGPPISSSVGGGATATDVANEEAAVIAELTESNMPIHDSPPSEPRPGFLAIPASTSNPAPAVDASGPCNEIEPSTSVVERLHGYQPINTNPPIPSSAGPSNSLFNTPLPSVQFIPREEWSTTALDNFKRFDDPPFDPRPPKLRIIAIEDKTLQAQAEKDRQSLQESHDTLRKALEALAAAEEVKRDQLHQIEQVSAEQQAFKDLLNARVEEFQKQETMRSELAKEMEVRNRELQAQVDGLKEKETQQANAASLCNQQLSMQNRELEDQLATLKRQSSREQDAARLQLEAQTRELQAELDALKQRDMMQQAVQSQLAESMKAQNDDLKARIDELQQQNVSQRKVTDIDMLAHDDRQGISSEGDSLALTIPNSHPGPEDDRKGTRLEGDSHAPTVPNSQPGPEQIPEPSTPQAGNAASPDIEPRTPPNRSLSNEEKAKLKVVWVDGLLEFIPTKNDKGKAKGSFPQPMQPTPTPSYVYQEPVLPPLRFGKPMSGFNVVPGRLEMPGEGTTSPVKTPIFSNRPKVRRNVTVEDVSDSDSDDGRPVHSRLFTKPIMSSTTSPFNAGDPQPSTTSPLNAENPQSSTSPFNGPSSSGAPPLSGDSEPSPTPSTNVWSYIHNVGAQVDNVATKVDAMGNKMDALLNSQMPTPSGRQHGPYSANRKMRKFGQARRDFMGIIRRFVREMFNIRKDDEILVAVQTHGFAISPDDAAAAKVTGQHAIDFEHPLVCWNDLKSAWNEELAEVFADRVLEEYSEFSRDNVKTQFHERLKALKKSMKKGVEKPGAPSPVDRKVTDMKADRRRSRKKKIFVDRFAIAAEHVGSTEQDACVRATSRWPTAQA